MSTEPDQKLPPGPYLLSLVWFARKTSNGGNEYLRCRFVVCSGPKKGVGFFTPWGLDPSKPGSVRRWEVWMEQVGCDTEIELSDDRMIARHFKGKAFKAEVKTATRGEYTNTDIDRLVYPRHYTDHDHKMIEEWNTEWAQRGWQQTDPGQDPGPSADDAPPAPQSEPQWSEGSSFRDDTPPNPGDTGNGPDDDDCPF